MQNTTLRTGDINWPSWWPTSQKFAPKPPKFKKWIHWHPKLKGQPSSKILNAFRCVDSCPRRRTGADVGVNGFSLCSSPLPPIHPLSETRKEPPVSKLADELSAYRVFPYLSYNKPLRRRWTVDASLYVGQSIRSQHQATKAKIL